MLVQHFLEKSARLSPDKIALICGDQKFTYRELNITANQLAISLTALGIRKHDRVLIFLDNSSEAVVGLFGILKAGATFIMPNATMKEKKLKYIIKDSGARILITHNNKMRVVKKALQSISNLEHIIICPQIKSKSINQMGLPTDSIKTHSWDSLINISSQTINKPIPQQIDIDLATIIYTSGSTGNPKGVMSAHYNIESASQSIIQYLENVEDDVILSALPLSFDYGLYQVLMAFRFGGTVVLRVFSTAKAA